MKFLFDHDVPDDMAYGLTALGHEVFKLRELLHPQTSDEDVLRFAGEHDYVLITCNRDDFSGGGAGSTSPWTHNTNTPTRARSGTGRTFAPFG